MIVGFPGVKTVQSPTMENHTEIRLADQFLATMDWWRDAGVDYEFSDEVVPLLSEDEEEKVPPQRQTAEPEAQKPHEPAVQRTDLPSGLAAFRDWWVGPDNPFSSAPFAQASAPRLAPIGKEGAPIMVLVAQPEADDRDTLLSGPQGRLVANVLRAIGLDPNAAYMASALPCHTTLPDWDDLGREGLGTILAHHLALAKPQRVLLMGSKLPALLGHDPAMPPDSFSAIDGIATLATFAPDRLLDHARQRARLWKRLCQWTAPA